MRNKNRYQRNRIARHKYWNRIRSKSHPYETYMPYSFYGSISPGNSTEDQIKDHFEWIDEKARKMDIGNHPGFFHAPKDYRHAIDRRKKAQVRNALQKINLGDYDTIIPTHKRDADWLYF
jgi:hypothetical protein